MNGGWTVRHTKTFYRELSRLPAAVRERIEAIAFGEAIQSDPLPLFSLACMREAKCEFPRGEGASATGEASRGPRLGIQHIEHLALPGVSEFSRGGLTHG
jgi:hypothetical protein